MTALIAGLVTLPRAPVMMVLTADIAELALLVTRGYARSFCDQLSLGVFIRSPDGRPITATIG